MTDAIISRGSTSVTIPLLGEGGEPVVHRDVGLPNQHLKAVGREDPVPQSHLSAQEQFVLTGMFIGSSAYTDAKKLAEDIVKPRLGNSETITLDLSALPQHGTYDVAFPAEDAVTLTYPPGQRDMVAVQVTATIVNNVFGGDQTTNAPTTPDSGSGVTVARDSTSVTLTDDIEVVRTVGRPGGRVQPTPLTHPNIYDMHKPAADRFEISGEFVGSSAESDARTLVEDIVRPPLGYGSLSVSFNGSLYGLEKYDVVPEGSQAARTTFTAAEKAQVSVPTLTLRVVDPTA